MKSSKGLKPLFFIFFFVAISFCALAQQTTVHIGGDVSKPFDLDEKLFSEMKQNHVKVVGRDSVSRDYTGVSLYDIVVKAGGIVGGQLKGKELAKYILVTAADGYRIVLAIAEIDPGFSNHKILLVNKENGSSLAPNYGPYRLIVAGDNRPARSAMRVVSIDIFSADKR